MEQNLGLVASEFQTVDDYLRQSKTSVLTILFTDIEGYTEFTDKNGDARANEIRKIHDDIMLEEIETKFNGKIIKFIGDAVMAIFSEPSSAAHACVEIQRKMLHLYETQKFPLKVRMGLHLGQVTIEQKIGHDIFGRHVNKASRVEAMASGGQIYGSYSVIETLKGNVEIEGVNFVSHGFVKAKGIADKFEIFEVLFLRSQKPKGPIGTKEKLLTPKVLISALVSLILVLILSYNLYFPKLYLYRAPQVPLILNHQTILNLKNVPNQIYKEIHENIPLGEHFVYYQISTAVRYYAPLSVKVGSQFIKPKYELSQLPSVSNTLRLLEEKEHIENERESELEYKLITSDFKREKKKVMFKSQQSIEKIENGASFRLNYEFTGPEGKVFKGSFQKTLNKKKRSFNDSISIVNIGEHQFSIMVGIWKSNFKITYSIDYKNIEKD